MLISAMRAGLAVGVAWSSSVIASD